MFEASAAENLLKATSYHLCSIPVFSPLIETADILRLSVKKLVNLVKLKALIERERIE